VLGLIDESRYFRLLFGAGWLSPVAIVAMEQN
jgi:hypothetical protein